MLSQSFSRKKLFLRTLALTPIVGLCVSFFNQDIVAQARANTKNNQIKDIEHIDIKILEKGHYTINGKKSTLDNFSNILLTFNKDLSKKDRQNIVKATILSPAKVHIDQVKKIKHKLIDYGIKQLQIPGGLIIPDSTSNSNHLKSNHPTKADLTRWLDPSQYGIWLDGERIKNEVLKEYHQDDLPYYTESTLEKNAVNYGKHYVQVNIMTNPYWQEKSGFHNGFKELYKNNSEQTFSNYAEEFLEGAQKNSKKALVIEIKNNTIKINNKPSSKETFVNDINTITKDWTKEDFKNPAQSYLFKDNTDIFLDTLEKEYTKTEIANKTGNSKLVPPSPPSPSSLETLPPPPPPSVEDHLFKMNRLGGIFFYENKKITYKKAQKLIKNNLKLNVNTPFPYSNPPKTFISRPSYTQDASYKKGDTITITVTDTGQKAYAIMNSDKKGTIIDKKPEDAGVGEKELNTYNSLVQRVNNLLNNKDSNLTKEDIKLLKSIYINMNKEQKANNQPYPLSPPTIEDKVKNELERIEKLNIIYKN